VGVDAEAEVRVAKPVFEVVKGGVGGEMWWRKGCFAALSMTKIGGGARQIRGEAGIE